MENVVSQLRETIGDLKLIKNLFEDNAQLNYLSVSFFKDTDDGDYNTYIDKITINTTELVPNYPDKYFDSIEDVLENTPEPYDCDGVSVGMDFITTLDEAIWNILFTYNSDGDEVEFTRDKVLALNFQNLDFLL